MAPEREVAGVQGRQSAPSIDRTPWDRWTFSQWMSYRSTMVEACSRLGEKWASNVGRACVAGADFYLSKFEEGS